MCAYDLFGYRHLVFATDFPFASPQGVSTVINSIEEMDIRQNEKMGILEGNAKELFNL